MRTRHFAAFVVVAAGTAITVLACGDSPAPGPVTPSSSNAAPSSSVVTTDPPTTTMNLGDGGDLLGTKLTTTTKTTIETKGDGGVKGPGRSDEPGRKREDIQTIVQGHRDEARACYDNGLKDHPGIEGDLYVNFLIDPQGTVTEATIDHSKSSIHEEGVGNCVMDAIKKIKFNASAKGYETRASYPFNFHPKGNTKK